MDSLHRLKETIELAGRKRLQIMVEGDTIREEDLPANLREDSGDRLRLPVPDGAGTLKEARESFERLYIERQLKRHDGNVTRTAQALGLERSHLHRKLRAYGIAPPHRTCGSSGEVSVLKLVRRQPSAAVACPQCGSTHTVVTSEFGSTACKALYKCLDCQEPFDYFKPY